MDTNTVFNEFRSTWEEMKHALVERDQEVKTLGDASSETKAKIDQMNSRMDELEAKMQRPGLASGFADRATKETADSEVKQAFLDVLRKGYHSLTPEQRQILPLVSLSEAKTMNLGSDSAGGVLAYPEFVNEILKEILVYSPVRSLATVRQTNNKTVQFRKRTAPLTASWVTEYQSDGTPRPKTQSTYGLEEIPNFELWAEVDVTEQLLEDSAFDLAQEITSDAGEQFGIAEGKAFISGNGTSQPEGILTNANVPAVTAKATTAFDSDDLVNLYYDLPDAYARNGTFLMKRADIGKTRLLKDLNGLPLWQPTLAPGAPSTILGAPYVECPDMPNTAAGTTPIVFGDIRRGYYITDRIGIVVKRLNELYAHLGVVGFVVRKRVGGKVVMPPAIRKLKMAAA